MTSRVSKSKSLSSSPAKSESMAKTETDEGPKRGSATTAAPESSAAAALNTSSTSSAVGSRKGNVQVFDGGEAKGSSLSNYNDKIADYALEHQKFGGKHFNPYRMTWIKPSFAWMLFRSGYGRNITRQEY